MESGMGDLARAGRDGGGGAGRDAGAAAAAQAGVQHRQERAAGARGKADGLFRAGVAAAHAGDALPRQTGVRDRGDMGHDRSGGGLFGVNGGKDRLNAGLSAGIAEGAFAQAEIDGDAAIADQQNILRAGADAIAATRAGAQRGHVDARRHGPECRRLTAGQKSAPAEPFMGSGACRGPGHLNAPADREGRR
jgi:hypothetical protein